MLSKAEDLFVDLGEKNSENLVSIEIWRGQIARKNKEDKKAEHHLLRAYKMAAKSSDLKRLSFISKELASFYAASGSFKLAYSYESLHADYTEKYVEELNRHKIWELEAKYDFERRKQEAELLILQANRLQLKALRAQMNPHFLYNALNSIQHFITSNDMTHAAKYLAKFAKLMRQSLEFSDVEVISLDKEIEFLENYLFINEKLRFAEKLSYKVIVSDDLEEDLIGVPAMIVQPYLENAIEHGLRSKKEGLLEVTFLPFNEQCIQCIIQDNGIGREKALALQKDSSSFQHHKSKGTLITEQRLHLLHKSLGTLPAVKIIDLKDETTGIPRGTRVEVLIPLMELER
jgi:LytS/YehU family sensor histidine kinase